MEERALERKGLVVRHSLLERIEHWAVALSGLVLVATGFFELPVARRYFITEIPGLGWSGDYITSLGIHYAASAVFIAAALFHLVHHGLLRHDGMVPRRGDLRASVEVIRTFFGKGEEPPFDKYLPEQRLAWAGMAVIMVLLILSGLLKTWKNLVDPQMSPALVLTATWVHNGAFLLFILAFVAHIGALILKPNRPMVRSIFTGTVRLDYARKRHPLWMSRLEGEGRGPEKGERGDTGNPAGGDGQPPGTVRRS